MSINNRLAEIKDIFDVFDDPMDKYTQIIEFGKKNKGLSIEHKNDTNRIFGCASLAWIYTMKKNDFYSISTDSDTFIVKGLLNILEYVINDSGKDEIIKMDVKDILINIGLENSITSQRTNGFLSALEKIKKQINHYE
jgi:cysteine desulfuration protein SufE